MQVDFELFLPILPRRRSRRCSRPFNRWHQRTIYAESDELRLVPTIRENSRGRERRRGGGLGLPDLILGSGAPGQGTKECARGPLKLIFPGNNDSLHQKRLYGVVHLRHQSRFFFIAYEGHLHAEDHSRKRSIDQSPSGGATSLSGRHDYILPHYPP
jgi:hypothetical protein